MNRVFVDMDGVIADFDRAICYGDKNHLIEQPGFFASLDVMPGAKVGINYLLACGYDVWIASKPMAHLPASYQEKAQWLITHFPEVSNKLILTQDKGLLGGREDYLIDDFPENANCYDFDGCLVVFGDCNSRRYGVEYARNWSEVIQFFRNEQGNYVDSLYFR